ncbi:hypothetical protein GCM10010103_37360 [Streptomyces paradoxus]
MPSDIWTSRALRIMQGPCAEVWDRVTGPAPAVLAPGASRPVPAEVLTVKVRAVTQARAARRRLGIRWPGGPVPSGRGCRGCGCLQGTCKGPPAPRQPPVSGCTLAITLRRGAGGTRAGGDRSWVSRQ